MMDKQKDLTQEIITIDESMREMTSLAELYEDLLKTTPKSDAEAASIKEQASFARERILKLSLHVKNTLELAKTQERL
jgi:hypothetical protein